MNRFTQSLRRRRCQMGGRPASCGGEKNTCDRKTVSRFVIAIKTTKITNNWFTVKVKFTLRRLLSVECETSISTDASWR